MIPDSLPVRIYPQHKSCCPFLCWQIHCECFMLPYAAGGVESQDTWIEKWRWTYGDLNQISTLQPPKDALLGCPLPGGLVCWGRRLIAHSSLLGDDRAYDMKLLPNARLMAWDIAKLTNFISWSTIGRKRWLVKEVAFCQNLLGWQVCFAGMHDVSVPLALVMVLF